MPAVECVNQSDLGTWHVRLSSLQDLSELEAKWIELQSRAECSFFQSWGWVGSWIAALPLKFWPKTCEVRLDDRLVGLALLGNHKIWRYGIIPSNALFVTQTGRHQFDFLTVEHNGFLVDKTSSVAALREGLNGLVKLLDWDELFLSGIVRSRVSDYLTGAERAQLRPLTIIAMPYYFVDCDRIRQTGGDYLSALSSNTRYQVRRAKRAYEERGPIRFQIAETLEQAQHYFEDLRRLHQQYWVAKGAPGAFGSAFGVEFHHRLIQSRFSKGEVQLAEIRAGTEPIGYLYNFVFGGVIYNYQSAFHYNHDAKLKPGLVSHCCAVQHSIEAGMKTYDLLMGKQRFKQNLATHSGEMVWLVLQKPRMRFRLERAVKRWRQRLRGTSVLNSPHTSEATHDD